MGGSLFAPSRGQVLFLQDAQSGFDLQAVKQRRKGPVQRDRAFAGLL